MIAPFMTDARARVAERLAPLFTYPDATLDQAVALASDAALAGAPDVADEIARFAAGVGPFNLTEREELFTRSFDMSPKHCLELGWHKYGERYERGAFLVRMRDALRRHGISESGELPDHLTCVLPLLAALPESERAELVAEVVRPALEKLVAAFDESDHPWRHALLAAAKLVGAEVPERKEIES